MWLGHNDARYVGRGRRLRARTINGGTLPVRVLTQTNLTLDIAAETLFMTSGGTFSDVTHYIRSDSVGTVDLPADTLGGTWTVKGNVVSYSATNGSTFVGTFGGGSILIEGVGLSFRYIK